MIIVIILIIIIIIIIITITITITIAYGYNTALNHVILIKRYKHCNAMKFVYSSCLHFCHITHYHALSRIITHYHALPRITTFSHTKHMIFHKCLKIVDSEDVMFDIRSRTKSPLISSL